jgi:hypothetical protein
VPRMRRATWTTIVLSAALATAAQLAPWVWRLEGHGGGYYADTDELFYASLVRRSARVGPATTNPFDVEWRHASSPYGTVLPQLLALPVRLGVPPGLWSDLSRWAATGTSAYLLVQLGAEVAAPAVGAAAATLVLLDPGTYYGKPLLRLLTGRWEPRDEPQQLPMSRLFTPSYLLPFYLAALLVLLRAAGPRGRRPRAWVVVAAFAGLGLAGYFFFWTAALTAAAAVALLHRHGGAVRRWFVPAVVATAVFVALNGLGTRDAVVEHALRLGFIRTRRPQFLLHAGYWVGALVALWLWLGRYRGKAAARALGVAVAGIWGMVLLVSPITGWDVQSHHFNMALDPPVTIAWCAAAWYGWRALRRPAWATGLATALVTLAAYLGPSLAMRGLAASREGGGGLAVAGAPVDWAAAQRLAAAGGVGPADQIAVPRTMRYALGLALPSPPYWYPFEEAWGIPDTALFGRSVCAALLTGEDSALTRHLATPHQRGATVWPDGRPARVSLGGRRDYFALMPLLADSEAAEVGRLSRSPAALRQHCPVLPGFALAAGRGSIRRAARAAAALGGAPAWVAPDSSLAWFRLPQP